MDILPVTSYTALSNFSRIYDFFTLVCKGHATICSTLLSTFTILHFFCFRGYYFSPLMLQAFAFAFLILVVPPWRCLVLNFHDANLRTFILHIKFFTHFFSIFLKKLSFCGVYVHFLRKGRKNNTKKVAQKACGGTNGGGVVPLYIVRALTLVCVRLSIILRAAPPPLHLHHLHPATAAPTPSTPRHRYTSTIYTTPPPPRHICKPVPPQPTHETVSGAGPVLSGLLRLFPFRYAKRCKMLKSLSAQYFSY